MGLFETDAQVHLYQFTMKRSLFQPLLMRIIRVGAVLFAATFLGVGAFFALSEPRGFDGNVRNALSGSQDLLLRHNEVRMLLMGENIYQFDTVKDLNQRTATLLGAGQLVGADYFPSTLLPVLLMARLPFDAVKTLWLIISLGSLVLLVCTMRWMMAARGPCNRDQMLMTCLWICGIPFWSCLAMGQASIFSVALTLAAFRADCARRPLLGGVLLAFGVFKYALIWPLVLFFFIMQWRWRCLLVGGGIHVGVHLVLCRIINANPITIFADVLSGNTRVFNHNSLLTVWMPFRSWNEMFPSLAVPAKLCGAILLLVMLGGLLWLWLRRKKTDHHNLIPWAAVLLLLSLLAVSSRIFSHMYGLLVLWIACSPTRPSLSWFQRTRLITLVLYLCYVPSGVDNLGVSEQVLQALRIVFNLALAALAVDLGRLLLAGERSAAQTNKAAALRS